MCPLTCNSVISIKYFFVLLVGVSFSWTGLLLLDYLVKNGSERVVTSAREHIYDLRSLENYTFVDEMGKDQGVNGKYCRVDKMYNLTFFFFYKLLFY